MTIDPEITELLKPKVLAVLSVIDSLDLNIDELYGVIVHTFMRFAPRAYPVRTGNVSLEIYEEVNDDHD